MKTRNDKALTLVKNTVSIGLLVFSITVIMGLIFSGQTMVSENVHPMFAFVTIWAAVSWLSMVEGQQASLVGLAPVESTLYRDSHPRTYHQTSLLHRWSHSGSGSGSSSSSSGIGNRRGTGNTGGHAHLDRYLMGRQFLVVMIVFVINLCGAPLKDSDASMSSTSSFSDSDSGIPFPPWVTQVFLVSGLATVLFTANLGQLTTQVVASHHMLDYIDNVFAVCTLYVAMAVEVSGVFHVAYLVRYLVTGTGASSDGNDHDHVFDDDDVASFHEEATAVTTSTPPSLSFRSRLRRVLFWIRVAGSLAILGFSVAVTLEALRNGQTTVWDGVPEGLSVVILALLMGVVGLLEAMHVAFFAVAKLSDAERHQGGTYARKTCELLFPPAPVTTPTPPIHGNGHSLPPLPPHLQHFNRLPGFMIGRQLCAVTCMVVIARITTLNVRVSEGEDTVFGVSPVLQRFFNTGLLGAVVTTVLGSISWQLVASAVPHRVVGHPAVFLLLKFCLFLESTGVCAGAWILAGWYVRVLGFQRDEAYIGTAEERGGRRPIDDSTHSGATEFV